MGRFANSWEIVKASGRVIRQDKQLLVLPVLSFVASALTVACVVGVAWKGGAWPQVTDPATGTPKVLAIAVAALGYLGLAFANIFFAAAVVAGAYQRLSGQTPTLGTSMAAAWRRVGRLFAWAVVTATVSVLLQIVRERGGLVGRWFAFLGSMAWNLATYFAIPVLLLEDAPVKESIGRAGSLFKKTWGETVIGTGGVGAVFSAAFMVVLVLLFMAVSSRNMLVVVPAVAIGIGCLVLISILQSVFGGVYKAALYRYASTGQIPTGFQPQHIQGAFVPR